MASVLSLAIKINADASGLKLDPVEKALQRLGQETDKVTGIFDRFTGTSEAAARAQEQTASSLEQLIEARREGSVTAQEFADSFDRIRDAATEEANALQRAGQITEQSLTPVEKYDRALAELDSQFQAGRISQETYGRAAEAAAKGLDEAERASRGLGAATEAIESSTASTTLQFNELSGVFAALPGPLGNIAGRLSGLSSAGEGLSRVFSGGLSQGLTSIGTSIAGLINPFTVAAAGILGFGAAASAVIQGLTALEQRVEQLGRLADQLGVSFGFVQVLEEAGNRSDVSIQQLSSSFGRLQNTLAGADDESKKAASALEALGITVSEFSALSEKQQIQLIGERLATIEDPAQRSAAAIDLFGKSGVQLLPFFKELPGAATDIERLGRSVTDLDRQRLADFGAGLDALSVASAGLGTSLLLPFAGLGEGIANALAEVISGITRVVDPIGRLLAPALSQLGAIIEIVGVGLGSIGRIFGIVADAIEPVGQFLLPAVVAQLLAMNAAAIAGGISSLVTTFVSAGAAAVAFATSQGLATAATVIFGTAIRALLASTGIGALVVGLGLAVNALIDWFSASEDVNEELGNTASSAAKAADETGRLADELARDDAAIAESAAKAIDTVQQSLSKAIEESTKFGQAGFDAALEYQTAIQELQTQFDKGILNEESFRREAENATAAYNAQIDTIKKAAAETEAITSRVDALLAKANEIPQAQKDLNDLQAEIARVEAELVAARASSQNEQANALAARLAQLDQLQAQLNEQADESAQGFSDGFDKAFEEVDKGIGGLIDKAAEFGNEGAEAAAQLTAGIEAAKEAVKDGILNKTAFDAEVARQNQLFEDRVAGLQEAAEITEEIYAAEAELLAAQFEIEKSRAEELAAIRTGSVQVSDFREGGVGQFFDTLREDPSVDVVRKQLAELQKQSAEIVKQREKLEQIRIELRNLNADTVDILGGVG